MSKEKVIVRPVVKRLEDNNESIALILSKYAQKTSVREEK